jgi:serine phosphatase RsbU (regulator of sigma subunit)
MEVWGGSEATSASVSMSGLDAWVYCAPFEQADAGGDVYYVSSCATGRIVRLLLADVSGHGAAVRETATCLRDLMRRCVNQLKQTTFVKSMNRQFVGLNSTGCFATAIVTTFFAPTRTLTLCNAGHPAPLLYRAASREWSLVRSSTRDRGDEIANIPLGIDDIADYEQFAIELDVGDLVICYSDSLIESHGGPSDDAPFLGEDGLLRVVRECRTIDPARPADVVPALLDRIRALNPSNLVADDSTVLLFRPNGTAPRPTLRQTLGAPYHFMVASIASLRHGDWRLPFPDFTLANVGGLMIPALNRLWRGRKTS